MSAMRALRVRGAQFGACAFVVATGVASAQCMTFPAHADYAQSALGLVAADVDGDADIDLVATGPTVRVLINAGDGSLTARTAYAGPMSRVTAGDVDGDGDVDLVGNVLGSLGVLFNEGDGTFVLAGTYAAAGVDSVVLADFDADKDLDAACVHDAMVYTFTNRGDGSFDAAQAHETGGDNVWITAADLNADGAADLVTANRSDAQVYVLWNRGDGAFGPAQAYMFGGGVDALCVVAADFNADGRLDIAVSTAAFSPPDDGPLVRVLLNDDDGLFVAGPATPVTGSPLTIAAGDFDGDGRVDLAVATLAGQVTSVLLNRGDASFAVGASLSARPYPTNVCVADLNTDGRADVGVASFGLFPPTNYVSVFLNVACCRTDVTGDGLVDSADVIAFVAMWFEDQANGTLHADFNGDGVSNSTDVSEFVGVWFEEQLETCK